MYSNIRNVVWIVVLAGVAIGTLILGAKPGDVPASGAVGRPSALGYYLTDAVLTGTDTNGEILYQISARRIDENPDTALLTLESVLLEYRDDRAVPWRVHAAAALGPTTREYFELDGGVRIERRSGPDDLPVTIEAASLRIEPGRYFASTDGPVSFRVGKTSINATGLEARLKEGRIDLVSNGYGQVHQIR